MFADTLCELEFTAIAERMIASAICFEAHNSSPLRLEERSRCVPLRKMVGSLTIELAHKMPILIGYMPIRISRYS
jgi:hypothetical protein